MPLPPGVAPAISATEHKVNWLAPACHTRILRVWSPNAMGAYIILERDDNYARVLRMSQLPA